MRKNLVIGIGVLYLVLSGGGGCNLFSDVSDKTSDAAIIDDVNNLIDAGLWNDAILKWETLSPAGQTVEANEVILATAYAGRGGLNVIDVANDLSGTADPTFFLTLLHAFDGSVIANFNDEVTAEGIMLNISGPASGRTTDENMFMVFLEMAKLGTLFAATADPTDTGSVSATFSGCDDISTVQAEHVVTGLSIMLDSLTQISSSIVSGAAAAIVTQCSEAPLNTTQLCGGIYQTSSVTPTDVIFAQTLVGESTLSIGLEAPLTIGHCEVSGGTPPCLTDVASTLCP